MTGLGSSLKANNIKGEAKHTISISYQLQPVLLKTRTIYPSM
jgi:hypothetical protein